MCVRDKKKEESEIFVSAMIGAIADDILRDSMSNAKKMVAGIVNNCIERAITERIGNIEAARTKGKA